MFGMAWLRDTISTPVALMVMLYSAVIVRMVGYKYEQEKLRVILRDLLIMLLAQAICRHKCNYLTYSTINILSSQFPQHNSLVNTIFII